MSIRPLCRVAHRTAHAALGGAAAPRAPKERMQMGAPGPVAPAESVAAKRSKVSDKIQQRAQKKAALTLTPEAVSHIRALLHASDGPKLLRVGVRNKGCAGMSYHLEYVTPGEEGRFDERVQQDGVEVLIDSRALFSIIGSVMDWQEDRMSAKFVFNNPNIKDACGCGESFMV
ncbi:unnamed protein product [Malassezia sympodialis ATCC 42132]|uniref:uncharacterized protein n=1 Tax=Malassezia sympodialis (strain ATCC 42132) TaxID=1230383 RepID=UPI0002C241A4|nr:uncharacterized protein MSY001_3434 [Malassezia sympodialis ATCC 42132]CCV00728.1 unnamed protein product [Malassezia sympodialis ATCC 42132]|eukprot:XP_018741905.1 uncharacterized protein MSY001_3434 [Malassezia sympodialis ATCC 42132]